MYLLIWPGIKGINRDKNKIKSILQRSSANRQPLCVALLALDWTA